MMRGQILTMALVGTLGLAGCEGMNQDERMIVGGLTGAAVGIMTAEMLDANDEWTIIAALGGAAAGMLVARNYHTGECAYARGDGTYRIRRC